MRYQEIVGIHEAYSSIYSQPVELSEEVQIAAQYFYEMGLNEEGVDILIEDLGVDEFVEFVYDIADDYVLTEARAGGVKIEPKTSKGKAIEGKPTAQSLKALRKKKAARAEAEKSASEAKPSGLKDSLRRQSAVVNAAKKQPKKPGLLDRVAGAVNRGIERHNKAMGELKKMKSATDVTVGKVKKAAGEFKKGFTEETDLYDIILSHLLDEGYAETPEAAKAIMVNMSEEWREEILEYRKLAAGLVGGMMALNMMKPGMPAPKVKTPTPEPNQVELVKQRDAATEKKDKEERERMTREYQRLGGDAKAKKYGITSDNASYMSQYHRGR